MAYVVTRTFGRDLRYLQVDEWNRTPPMWVADQDDALTFSNAREAQEMCLRYSGEAILET